MSKQRSESKTLPIKDAARIAIQGSVQDATIHDRLIQSVEFSPSIIKMRPDERTLRPVIKTVMPKCVPPSEVVEQIRDMTKNTYRRDSKDIVLLTEMHPTQIWKLREGLVHSMEKSPALLAKKCALHRSFDRDAPTNGGEWFAVAEDAEGVAEANAGQDKTGWQIFLEQMVLTTREFSQAEIVHWKPGVFDEATVGASCFVDTKAKAGLWKRSPQIWFLDGGYQLGVDKAEQEAFGLAGAHFSPCLFVVPCRGTKAKDSVPGKSSLQISGAKDAADDPENARHGLTFIVFFMQVKDDRNSDDQSNWSRVSVMAAPPHLRFLTTIYEGDVIKSEVDAQLLAAVEWTDLPVVVKKSSIERAERRRMERDQKPKQKGRAVDVYTVSLRQVVQRDPVPLTNLETGEEEAPAGRLRYKDFRCEVRGHWRKYRTINAGQPKWIDKFIKGNPDAPLRPPNHRIKVARHESVDKGKADA